VTDKIKLDDDFVYGDCEEGWYGKPSKAAIQKEWDNMVDLGDYQDQVPDIPRTRHHKMPSVGK
jgi:hypothetical protein